MLRMGGTGNYDLTCAMTASNQEQWTGRIFACDSGDRMFILRFSTKRIPKLISCEFGSRLGWLCRCVRGGEQRQHLRRLVDNQNRTLATPAGGQPGRPRTLSRDDDAGAAGGAHYTGVRTSKPGFAVGESAPHCLRARVPRLPEGGREDRLGSTRRNVRRLLLGLSLRSPGSSICWVRLCGLLGWQIAQSIP